MDQSGREASDGCFFFGVGFSGGDLDVVCSQAECSGEQFDDCCVGASVLGRGGDSDFETVAKLADDLAGPCAGNDFQTDPDRVLGSGIRRLA